MAVMRPQRARRRDFFMAGGEAQRDRAERRCGTGLVAVEKIIGSDIVGHRHLDFILFSPSQRQACYGGTIPIFFRGGVPAQAHLD
jgi:hypothetical protein